MAGDDEVEQAAGAGPRVGAAADPPAGARHGAGPGRGSGPWTAGHGLAGRRLRRAPEQAAAGTRGPVLWRLLLLGLLLGLSPVVRPAAPAAAAEAWRWPVDAQRVVVRPFAPGPTRYSAGHYGADLKADLGVRVRSVGPGRVTYAGLLAGRGVVVVDHGGLRTTYEPLTLGVVLGDHVVAGSPLGRLDLGHPCASAACLHLGLRRGETYLDPLSLFRGPPRLLPERSGGGAVAGRLSARDALPGRAAGPTSRQSGSEREVEGGAVVVPGRLSGAASRPGAAARGEAAGAAARPSARRAARPARSAEVALGGAGQVPPPTASSGTTWPERVRGDLAQTVLAASALVAGLVLVRRARPVGPDEGGSSGGSGAGSNQGEESDAASAPAPPELVPARTPDDGRPRDGEAAGPPAPAPARPAGRARSLEDGPTEGRLPGEAPVQGPVPAARRVRPAAGRPTDDAVVVALADWRRRPDRQRRSSG